MKVTLPQRDHAERWAPCTQRDIPIGSISVEHAGPRDSLVMGAHK